MVLGQGQGSCQDQLTLRSSGPLARIGSPRPLCVSVNCRTIAAKNSYSRQLSAPVQPALNSPIKQPGIAANCERWQPAKARRDSELAAGLIARCAGTRRTAENLKNRVRTLLGLFSTASEPERPKNLTAYATLKLWDH